ncbi:hypothetical protein AMTRI_Chr10g229020 [Amborella trichopoda]
MKADGTSDDCGTFTKAWNSATLHVLAGNYLLYPTTFGGPCKSPKITINLEGNLIASTDINKINKVEDGSGLEINGGVLDGKGARYWLYKEDDGDCPVGSNSLVFNKCKNVSVNNLTSMSSKMFHIIFYESGRVRIYGVKVRAPANRPNTDGIHVEGSSDVLITDANIHTGDDCISIRPGTHDMWVEQVTCGPGYSIRLGQYLDEPAAKRVWLCERESIDRVVMNNVENPIIMTRTTVHMNRTAHDQNYCPHEQNCPDQTKRPQASCIHAKGTAAGLITPPSCL